MCFPLTVNYAFLNAALFERLKVYSVNVGDTVDKMSPTSNTLHSLLNVRKIGCSPFFFYRGVTPEVKLE